ncbi:hypothetical protein GCM10025877_23050 [Agromyces mangrovi Wang et al. 2018]|nr:hypothetical protein GCM10025877_23050 [Agromyces mangrovi]
MAPGESYEHTFDRAGEYFFNDCTDPRPTGKIEVVLEPQVLEGALRFTPGTLQLASDTGLFTGVDGTITARLELPAGYEYESGAELITPLSDSPLPATIVSANKNRLIVKFDKSAVDNNVPTGETSLTLRANFLHAGEQVQLQSTATVVVVK